MTTEKNLSNYFVLSVQVRATVTQSKRKTCVTVAAAQTEREDLDMAPLVIAGSTVELNGREGRKAAMLRHPAGKGRAPLVMRGGTVQLRGR